MREGEERSPAFEGLTELAARKGWRPLAHTERDGVWLSERTVFRATTTGCTVWRLTCDPAVDVNDYYDIPSWNADGSVLGFLTRRRGGTGAAKGGLGAALVGGRERWLMDANGDHLRPMPTPDGRPIRSGYWSQHHRDRFYHARTDDEGTHVLALNPFTGQEQTVVRVKRDLGVMMPPHPSEKWFLFGEKIPGAEHVDTPS
jgi:hypothetical protein